MSGIIATAGFTFDRLRNIGIYLIFGKRLDPMHGPARPHVYILVAAFAIYQSVASCR
jgi:hypothetical protein